MKTRTDISKTAKALSHELRTPLNAILGYSELLSKCENLTDKQLSHLSNITKGGQQLLKIINEIIEGEKPSDQKTASTGYEIAEKSNGIQNSLSLIKKRDASKHSNERRAAPKALIVDDLVMNRTLARIMLETRNFETYEAENGKEAVQLYEKEKPDVILMDISMPVMDGVEALGQILEFQQQEHDAVPIIAVTAGGHAGSRSELMKKGFSEYIQKPFGEKELLNKLSMFIPIPEANLKAVSEG